MSTSTRSSRGQKLTGLNLIPRDLKHLKLTLKCYQTKRDNHNTDVVNRVMAQALHKYLPENGTWTFHFPGHILIKDVRTIAHMTMSISITYDSIVQ